MHWTRSVSFLHARLHNQQACNGGPANATVERIAIRVQYSDNSASASCDTHACACRLAASQLTTFSPLHHRQQYTHQIQSYIAMNNTNPCKVRQWSLPMPSLAANRQTTAHRRSSLGPKVAMVARRSSLRHASVARYYKHALDRLPRGNDRLVRLDARTATIQTIFLL